MLHGIIECSKIFGTAHCTKYSNIVTKITTKFYQMMQIRSQTGSGKTLAYAVPIIECLQGIDPRIKRTDGIFVIIVVPTRELALQTHEIFNKINVS